MTYVQEMFQEYCARNLCKVLASNLVQVLVQENLTANMADSFDADDVSAIVTKTMKMTPVGLKHTHMKHRRVT